MDGMRLLGLSESLLQDVWSHDREGTHGATADIGRRSPIDRGFSERWVADREVVGCIDDLDDAIGQRSTLNHLAHGADDRIVRLADQHNLNGVVEKTVRIYERRKGQDVASDFAGKCAKYRFGTLAIFALAGEIEQAREHADHRAVSSRDSLVVS